MKRRKLVRAFVGVSWVIGAGVAAAQHEGATAGAMQGSAEAAQCAQAQPVVEKIVAAAIMRLEAARQTNSAAQMRAAVDDLQGALRDLRAQLAPCAQLAAAAPADPHAGHATGPAGPVKASPAQTPGTPVMQPGSAVPAPGAAAPAAPAAAGPDPHAGHAMPKPSPAPRAGPATREKKPGATESPEKDAKEGQAAKVMDPVNGLMVDPAGAPTTTYQGQTYYFSSEQTRKEFLQNPAKFARKPKQ